MHPCHLLTAACELRWQWLPWQGSLWEMNVWLAQVSCAKPCCSCVAKLSRSTPVRNPQHAHKDRDEPYLPAAPSEVGSLYCIKHLGDRLASPIIEELWRAHHDILIEYSQPRSRGLQRFVAPLFSLVRKGVGSARAGMHACTAQRGYTATILYNATLVAGQ